MHAETQGCGQPIKQAWWHRTGLRHSRQRGQIHSVPGYSHPGVVLGSLYGLYRGPNIRSFDHTWLFFSKIVGPCLVVLV